MVDKEKISYKLGYAAGGLITKVIVAFAKLLFAGTITASVYCKQLPVFYLVLSIVAILSYAVCGTYYVILIFTMITAIAAGLWVREKERPVRERIKYFSTVFDEINLKANDGSTPIFLREEHISYYATQFVFQSLIPLAVWNSKKELLEMYFNKKILDIKQDKQNNRNVQVVVELRQLESFIRWSDFFVLFGDTNLLYVGMSPYGPVSIDLEKNTHAFIAGETGCGKSNILKCLIYQSLYRNYKTVLIDFKRGVSFSEFSDDLIVYYDYDSAKKILEDLVSETNNRLDLFRNAHVDNLNDYNRASGADLSRIIVFIDELAELLKTRDRELSNSLYDSIETLTRISRTVGINLIMGIQRPDSTIISGQIKNNVSCRICGRFVDKEPSRILLNCDAAAHLQNTKGRFIIKNDEMHEFQSFFFSKDYTIQLKSAANANSIEPIQPAPAIQESVAEKLNDNELDRLNNELTIETQNQNELNFDFSDIK